MYRGTTPTVREREVLRVAAVLGGASGEQGAAKARAEILEWAQDKIGDSLPEAAWKYNGFEKRMGGRDCTAVRVIDGHKDLWAIRVNDPDSNVAQRVWTTEVVIGFAKAQNASLGLRLLACSPELDLLDVERAVPKPLRQLANKCGLFQGARSLNPKPWIVESDGDIRNLIDLLLDSSRRDPVFVLSLPTTGTARMHVPLIDPQPLAHAMLGLARVVVVPARFTWNLTERLGKKRSVFGGAIRAYLPGFTEDADPYDHALFLRERLLDPTSSRQVSVELREVAAKESLRRFRLGDEVLSFSTVQAHSLEIESRRLEHENATIKERMDSYKKRIDLLEKYLKKSDNEQEWFAEQHDRAEERASKLKQQLNVADSRIRHLTVQLATHNDKPDSNIPLPDKWEVFSDWCEEHLSDRVVLSSRARREVKKPLFKDVRMAARCVVWLANDYRQDRLTGDNSSLRGPFDSGLINEPCGGDEFQFKWKGKQIEVGWHIKGGGNTRKPERCLRIYYFWDELDRQVVIASMPAHVLTGAT